jgi:hypothetical protein
MKKEYTLTAEQANIFLSHWKKQKKQFLKNAKHAPKPFVDMMECMYNSPEFENMPPARKELVTAFINARK